jgi:cathepsin L
MKIVLLLCALFAACYAVSVSDQTLQLEFTAWMQQHGKSYSTDEFQYRWQTWKHNHRFIQEHNAKNLSFTVEMNKFGDLSPKEFTKLYTGFLGDKANTRIHHNTNNVVVHPTVQAPASVDWRTKGVVTGVKNQGQCGSCWAFSTTGSTEGQHALETGQLVGLSEQNLVDCSGSYGNQGCDGGLMDDAFQYIIANGGIDTEAYYPYTAQDGTCHYNKADIGATLLSYTDVPSGSEAQLTNDCAAYGPISVAIDASHSSFQFYSGGVYYEPACSSTQLDHGVLAVGYGTLSSKAYYIVKNSWGTDWGMAGYILMSRNRNNNCGIATMASWPTAPKMK